MEVDIPRGASYPRSTSLNACLMILGADYDDVYNGERRGIHSVGTIYKRYEPYEIEYMASKLHLEAVKKFHPDLHRSRKAFYTKKLQEINAAYQRIKQILKYKFS